MIYRLTTWPRRALGWICLIVWISVAKSWADDTNGASLTLSSNSPVAVASPVPAVTNAPNPSDFKAFAVITARNIFSPSRTTPTAQAEVKHVPKIDLVSLVGTMKSGKGQVAFFDGSGPSFRGARQLSNEIAGFTVAGITADKVRLEGNGKTLALPVGGQLRREDGGEWTTAAVAAPIAGSDSGGPKPASGEPSTASAGGESEVLKRLLQKREQDLK